MLIGTSLLLVSIFMGSYLFRTRAYEVTPQQLIIRRPLKNRILEKSDIIKVEPFQEGALKGSTRVFGNGGLFGYYGKFSNGRFGYMTWYATNRANPVLLWLRGDQKIIVTPDEVEAFIAAFPDARPLSKPLPLQHT